MKATGRVGRIHIAATWTLAFGLASALVIPFVAGSSVAENGTATELGTEDTELAKKAEWQDRYRTLRTNAARMRAFVAENPQGKHGVHRYRASEYGIDVGRERERFRRYRERFGIEAEPEGPREGRVRDL